MLQRSPPNHHRTGKTVGPEQRLSRSRADDRPKDRRCRRARKGAERIKDGDRQSTDFQREDLTYGEIGRTCRRGSNEEYDGPGKRLRQRVQDPNFKLITGDRQQHSGRLISQGDHSLTPNRVKKVSHENWPE
jgi:hypothetical protein